MRAKGFAKGRCKASSAWAATCARHSRRDAMETAWQQALTVYIATKLNRSHLVHGQASYLLPCLGRSEEDTGKRSAGRLDRGQFQPHLWSSGKRKPANEHLLSELAIVAGMARRRCPQSRGGAGTTGPPTTPSSGIASPRLIPRSSTTSTRACLSPAASIGAMARTSASGRRKAARRSSPSPKCCRARHRRRARAVSSHHDALQRSVQHDDLRLQRPLRGLEGSRMILLINPRRHGARGPARGR